MSHKDEWDAEELLQAARGARRSEQDENYYRDEFSKALAELGRILNVRVAGDYASDDIGLVQTMDSPEEAAVSVFDGALLRRLQTLWHTRDDRAQMYARAAGVLWRVTQELQRDANRDANDEN